MSFYKWTQYVGGDESWSLLLAEHEQSLIREKKPAFTTILAADNNFTQEMQREDFQKVRYAGDFYTDFDASSLEEVIPQFQAFLTKLKNDNEFDLSQAQLFASGGKGFHCTIPHACFIPKVNPKGYAFLPAIFKEVAMNLMVDTLDLRVYTARRGRMFRTANVERPDKPGVHKVPITVAQAYDMTPELYRELCSEPRYIAPPSPPTLNSKLALIHATAVDKIETSNKNRKPNKLSAALVAQFKGAVPPSILKVMEGLNLAKGIGFQKVATQLSLTAHALGLTEEKFLELTEKLCETHESDGIRYNTKSKRRFELTRMYHYMFDNPCYEFSIGGVKSLMDKEVDTPDLDNGGVVLEEESDGSEPDVEIAHSIALGMKVSKSGLWKKTEDGLVKVCNVGMSDPAELIDLTTGDSLGYEVTIYTDGIPRGKRTLPMDTFLSRQKLMQFTLSAAGASVSATDPQVGALADILKQRAVKTGNIVYTTTREGIDLVILPDGRLDTIWADRNGVVSQQGVEYRLVGGITTKGAEYRTDLRGAPNLENNAKTIAYLENLFQINKTEQLAKMLGWFLACFLNQPLRYLHMQFPMIQYYGPAGAGKTSTARLLGGLHYWRTPVRISSASNSTGFAIKSLCTSSGSMPFILEELKPREMTKTAVDMVKMILKENYTGTEINRGRVVHGSGQSVLENSGPRNVAPIAYLGEALESQSALMERAVIVNLDKESKHGRSAAFLHAQSDRQILSAFGYLCAKKALNIQLDELNTITIDNIRRVADAMGPSAEDNDRPVYNMAVVLTGLGFGKQVLQTVFGNRFDKQFEDFEKALLEKGHEMIVQTLSEAAKVLNTMAYLTSIIDDFERCKLDRGIDYIVDGSRLELNLRNVYAKYVRYNRSLNQEVLFDNVEAFIAAMRSFSPLVDKNGLDSPLKITASTVVYTFDIEKLTKEGVGVFKS